MSSMANVTSHTNSVKNLTRLKRAAPRIRRPSLSRHLIEANTKPEAVLHIIVSSLLQLPSRGASTLSQLRMPNSAIRLSLDTSNRNLAKLKTVQNQAEPHPLLLPQRQRLLVPLKPDRVKLHRPKLQVPAPTPARKLARKLRLARKLHLTKRPVVKRPLELHRRNPVKLPVTRSPRKRPAMCRHRKRHPVNLRVLKCPRKRPAMCRHLKRHRVKLQALRSQRKLRAKFRHRKRHPVKLRVLRSPRKLRARFRHLKPHPPKRQRAKKFQPVLLREVLRPLKSNPRSRPSHLPNNQATHPRPWKRTNNQWPDLLSLSVARKETRCTRLDVNINSPDTESTTSFSVSVAKCPNSDHPAGLASLDSYEPLKPRRSNARATKCWLVSRASSKTTIVCSLLNVLNYHVRKVEAAPVLQAVDSLVESRQVENQVAVTVVSHRALRLRHSNRLQAAPAARLSQLQSAPALL